MKLHEYQAKQIYTEFGIPIPRGQEAANSINAKQIAEELACPVVIKAQVLTGGRGKSGGIRIAKSPEEAETITTEILGMTIHGFPVHKVLVEEAITINNELYLGLTIDRTLSQPVLISSASGGIDIETTAQQSPEKITRMNIHSFLGFQAFQARILAVAIDLPREYWKEFQEITSGLWFIFQRYDALLVEINPLVVTSDHRLISLDAKMEIDDSSLFRHPDLSELRDLEMEDSYEIEARKYGLSYIKMQGNIGCMVNGAGLAMTTMDLIKLNGGEPANFLDIGGGASSEKVAAGLRIILSDKNVKSILVNIFGGITRCDEVAQGLIKVLSEVNSKIPITLRLEGNNAEKASEIVSQMKMENISSLNLATKRAVEKALG
jgi:succinyl-CoA synthetase beta subunit